MLKEYPKEAAKALYVELGRLQKASMKLTPVKTDALRGSTEREKPKQQGNTISGKVKVGGPAAPYAVIVHYRPAQHTVGQDRYLETALNNTLKGLQARLGKQIKKQVERKMKRKGGP